MVVVGSHAVNIARLHRLHRHVGPRPLPAATRLCMHLRGGREEVPFPAGNSLCHPAEEFHDPPHRRSSLQTQPRQAICPILGGTSVSCGFSGHHLCSGRRRVDALRELQQAWSKISLRWLAPLHPAAGEVVSICNGMGYLAGPLAVKNLLPPIPNCGRANAPPASGHGRISIFLPT